MLKRLLKQAACSFGYDIVRVMPANVPSPEEKRRAEFMHKLGVDLVVDVGANTGQYALATRRGGYKGKILSFEPIRAVYEQLARTASSDKQWKCLPMGLSDRSTRSLINVAANNGESSSLLPMGQRHIEAAPQAQYLGQEEITLMPLEDVADDYLTEARRIWLKIDVQGYERFVLNGACQILPRTAVIEMELSMVRLYDGQDLIEDAIGEMRSKGFLLVAVEEAFVDPLTGHVLQFSGTFVRDMSAGNAFS